MNIKYCMRIEPEESFEQWALRVQKFELARAKKELDSGIDVNLVMEAMSARIQEKLMYPIYKAIKESKSKFDAEASRKAYEEAYLKKNSPKADHLTDD